MSRTAQSRIVTDEREGVYKPSGKHGRATTPRTSGKPQKGGNRPSYEKRRCEVCGHWYMPIAKDQKVCSDECRIEKRRRKDRDRYRKSVGGVLKEKKPTAKKPAVKKECHLTHRGQLKQIFATAKEALASLKPKEIEAVERVMSLPHSQRWEAGAKDWTEAQRVLARKIELKQIALDAKMFEEEEDVQKRLAQFAQTDQEEKDEDDYSDGETSDNFN